MRINPYHLIILGFIFCEMSVAEDLPPRLDSATLASSSQVASVPEAWQRRRAQFAKTVQSLQLNDTGARMAFDSVLTEFETAPLDRTPLENLDILGIFYVPKEGMEKTLPIIVMNQTLGWYDALRFGTESGRAEIVQREAFFKRPFVIAGPDAIKQMSTLMRDSPALVLAAIKEGQALAEKFKNDHPYDEHWPTAYGLERVICAQGGSCETPLPMPKNQWPAAWQMAKQRILDYYVPTRHLAQ